MRCYSCLDLDILETTREAHSKVPEFRSSFVDLVYKGDDPGTCENAQPITCPKPSEICVTVHAILSGICE